MSASAAAGGTAILYVDDSAPSFGNGASWSTAYRFLADALTAAPADCEIRIGQGVYRPDRTDGFPSGTGDRSATFAISLTQRLRGGFAGFGAADPDAQDPALYPTILSGDLAGDDSSGGSSAENTRHIVTSTQTSAGAGLEGLVVAFANGEDEPGGGLLHGGGDLTIEECVFTANTGGAGGGASFTGGGLVAVSSCEFSANVSLAGGGGAIRKSGAGSLAVDGCTFLANTASYGGAIRTSGSSTSTDSFVGCTFQGNTSPGPAGAIYKNSLSQFWMMNCVVEGSTGLGGGGIFAGDTQIGTAITTHLLRCTLRDCAAEAGGGAFFAGAAMHEFVACRFIDSSSPFPGGGGLFSSGPATATECVFSRNASDAGADLDLYAPMVLAASTVANGIGFSTDTGYYLDAENCVFWGSSLPPFGGWNDAQVTHSLVQGGYPGVGNIDGDPLFIQPGSDDLRLGLGSPALDAGAASLLPPDALDLDGDGDVLEPLPLDLAGAPRVQGAALDMGAYEGAYEPLDPSAQESDLDPGETVVLVPTGADPNPVLAAFVAVTNVGGPPDATFAVTQLAEAVHSGAGGFTEQGDVLALATTLGPAQFATRVFVPIDPGSLAGLDPFDVDLGRYDAAQDAWVLAVKGNATSSPGHDGPVGDRVTMLGSGGAWLALTQETGDYGVYWDTALNRGFVFANVDTIGDFGFGASLCDADVEPGPGDGLVDQLDLVALLGHWGSADTALDLDGSGAVDGADLGALLAAWGGCLPPAAPAASPAIAPRERDPGLAFGPVRRGDPRDLDRDGRVDGRDLGMLYARWGVIDADGDRRGDVDGNGRIDRADVERLLGRR